MWIADHSEERKRKQYFALSFLEDAKNLYRF